MFYKANLEFNSVDSKISKDSRVSRADMVNDYLEYLPETDKNELLAQLSIEYPKFQLDIEDSVHQF
jgi:hypothetical protein